MLVCFSFQLRGMPKRYSTVYIDGDVTQVFNDENDRVEILRVIKIRLVEL